MKSYGIKDESIWVIGSGFVLWLVVMAAITSAVWAGETKYLGPNDRTRIAALERQVSKLGMDVGVLRVELARLAVVVQELQKAPRPAIMPPRREYSSADVEFRRDELHEARRELRSTDDQLVHARARLTSARSKQTKERPSISSEIRDRERHVRHLERRRIDQQTKIRRLELDLRRVAASMGRR